MTAAKNIARSREWLRALVFPLWLKRGVDANDGGFCEALSQKGEPLPLPRRAMVQARQIFSFRVGLELGLCPEAEARAIIARAASFLIERYSAPSGAFIHTLGEGGQPRREQPELYTQAFALFGLANAYALAPAPALKSRAVKLVRYLQRERRSPAGGYTELEGGKSVLRSNPHMHLFEAALGWMQADADPLWRELADELLELCLTRFIDPETGMLGERFDEQWRHVRTQGHFIFEPGHHYEWSWLLASYEELTGRELGQAGRRLFDAGEAHGLNDRGFAMDEIWSHGAPHKRSSRFWPQTERIKAAVRLGARAPLTRRPAVARAADQAVGALFEYLRTPTPGLWHDTLLESGSFRDDPAKASSLYHIINAFAEYERLRPRLES